MGKMPFQPKHPLLLLRVVNAAGRLERPYIFRRSRPYLRDGKPEKHEGKI